MRRFLSGLAILGIFLTIGRNFLRAEDLYSFPDIDETRPKKDEQAPPKPVDPFIQALAKKMEIPEKILFEAAEKGFGRLELIRLILISKKSGKALPELIQEREKNTRFAKIAASTKTDNKAIKEEGETILKDLEKQVQYDLSHSTGTATAGVENKTKPNGSYRRHRHSE